MKEAGQGKQIGGWDQMDEGGRDEGKIIGWIKGKEGILRKRWRGRRKRKQENEWEERKTKWIEIENFKVFFPGNVPSYASPPLKMTLVFKKSDSIICQW